jgi:hypothetical protein
MIEIKPLSCRSSQRFTIQRSVAPAKHDLIGNNPEVKNTIPGMMEGTNIEWNIEILAAPCLMVNEKLMCVGRIQTR